MYKENNNIYIIYSYSDYMSNFPHNKVLSKITITDKNNKKIIIPFNAEEVNYPIKIKLWED